MMDIKKTTFRFVFIYGFLATLPAFILAPRYPMYAIMYLIGWLYTTYIYYIMMFIVKKKYGDEFE